MAYGRRRRRHRQRRRPSRSHEKIILHGSAACSITEPARYRALCTVASWPDSRSQLPLPTTTSSSPLLLLPLLPAAGETVLAIPARVCARRGRAGGRLRCWQAVVVVVAHAHTHSRACAARWTCGGIVTLLAA